MDLAAVAGQIEVNVKWQQGRIRRVELCSSRPQRLTELFCHKPLSAVVQMIPMLFSLCATAQQVAALRAAESALGLQVASIVERARDRLIQAETVRELGLKLFSDWLLDELGIKVRLIQGCNALNRCLLWAMKLNPPLPPVSETTVENEVLPELHEVFKLTDVAALTTDTILERFLLQDVIEQLVSLDKVEIRPGAAALDLDDSRLRQQVIGALAAEDAKAFCSQPSIEGLCYETSVLASVASDLGEQSGQGNELASASGFIRSRLQMLISHFLQLLNGSEVSSAQPKFEETGVSLVNAARGALLHRLSLDDSDPAQACITDYKIVAPTEWNFHPRGTLVQMLEGVTVEQAQLPQLVAYLIKLIDPCVGWTLKLETCDA